MTSRSLTLRADMGQENRSPAQRLARTTYRSGVQRCRRSNKGRQHRIGPGELADGHARRHEELIEVSCITHFVAHHCLGFWAWLRYQFHGDLI